MRLQALIVTRALARMFEAANPLNRPLRQGGKALRKEAVGLLPLSLDHRARRLAGTPVECCLADPRDLVHGGGLDTCACAVVPPPRRTFALAGALGLGALP